MPWKESSVMDERMRFVIRLKDGETMASLCREFGISRKTGYKIFERYEQCGPRWSQRPCPPAISAMPTSSLEPRRGGHRRRQAREAALGCSQDSRTLVTTPAARGETARRQHHPRHSRSPWPGHSHAPIPNSGRRYTTIGRLASQRSVGHRLQGRVPARGQTLLLSADRYRSCLTISVAVRSAGVQSPGARFSGL